MTAPDSLNLLSKVAPLSDEEAGDVFGMVGRDGLLDAITRLSPGPELSALRRLRRPLLIAVAVIVVAAATGAGWAALSSGPAAAGPGGATAVDCAIHGRLGIVIDAMSGDPAADCAAIWPAPVPKLQAYDDGTGGIAVIPASETAPAGWTPIESQDVALVVLQENLDDKINGLDSACFSSSQATTFAQQQLDLLGLVGWTTAVGSGPAASCYRGFADARAKTVTLIPMGDPTGPANWPPQHLADSVRPLTQQCLTLAAMKSDIVQRATALGMSPTFGGGGYVLKAVEDDALRCATVTETVAGETYVVVRGPAAP
jgi:hypothetical protein